MNIRQRKKKLLKYVPRHMPEVQYLDSRRPRKDAVYYRDWCCKGCYFDWGRGFEGRHLYKHNCAQSNYEGLLKKYWTDPDDYRYEEDQELDDERTTD